MSWGQQPLDTVITPNAVFFANLINDGKDAAAQAISAVSDLSGLIVPDLDFTGISPTFTYPTGVTITLPAQPTVPTYVTVPSYSAITPPTITLDQAITYTQIGTLATAAGTLLTDILTSASSAIEDALFDRGIDRETAAMATGYQNYLNNQSSMGFASATGQDAALYAAFETQKKAKLSDINRDITVTAFKEALVNSIGVLTGMVAAEQAGESNLIALYQAKLEQSFNQLKTITEQNKTLSETYGAQVQAFVAIAEAIYREDDAFNKYNEITANYALQKVKIIGDYEISKANASTERAKAIGSVDSTIMASYFNAASYNQTFTYGVSWGGTVAL
jgi:hypothetical protein